jgi:hypothetical protein
MKVNGQETGYVDIMEYVQRMRKDRMNMIQTKVSFIIKCTAPILKLTHAFETISYVISVVYCTVGIVESSFICEMTSFKFT